MFERLGGGLSHLGTLQALKLVLIRAFQRGELTVRQLIPHSAVMFVETFSLRRDELEGFKSAQTEPMLLQD